MTMLLLDIANLHYFDFYIVLHILADYDGTLLKTLILFVTSIHCVWG